jgi:hypothetical protein
MTPFSRRRCAQRRLALLVGVLHDCRRDCRAATRAEAWMYLGIVYGQGKNDYTRALTAFRMACDTDGQVRLDRELANQRSRVTFARAQRSKPLEYDERPKLPERADLVTLVVSSTPRSLVFATGIPLHQLEPTPDTVSHRLVRPRRGKCRRRTAPRRS